MIQMQQKNRRQKKKKNHILVELVTAGRSTTGAESMAARSD